MPDTIDLSAAAGFVWTDARLLDRLRFALHFEDGAAAPVVAALRAYRNDDGGFGHALEPDLRGTASQPGAVMTALEVLDEAGALDDPMTGAACDWLERVAPPEGGVPFVLDTVAEHPHAPWWQPGDPSPSLTLTGLTAGILLRGGVAHPWLDGATAWLWRRLEDLRFDGPYELRGAIAFLDHAADRERADATLTALAAALPGSGLVTPDPDAPGEGHTPLDYAPWPDAPSRRLVFDGLGEGLVERHLDALAAGQQDDGGWRFDWPAWSPGAEVEWRGVVTIHALRVLAANGRLEVLSSR